MMRTAPVNGFAKVDREKVRICKKSTASASLKDRGRSIAGRTGHFPPKGSFIARLGEVNTTFETHFSKRHATSWYETREAKESQTN